MHRMDMKAQRFLFEDLTSKIIGAAINVHKELGSAYEEKIYQRALQIEFQKIGIKSIREQEVNIQYSGIEVGKKKLDFVVEHKIIIELKKADEINNVHIAQVASYLQALRLKLGLILNFGLSKLQIKRVIAKGTEE